MSYIFKIVSGITLLFCLNANATGNEIYKEIKNWDPSKTLVHNGKDEKGPFKSTYKPLYDLGPTVVSADVEFYHPEGDVTLLRKLYFTTEKAVRKISFGSSNHGDNLKNKGEFEETFALVIDVSMALLESEKVLGIIGFKSSKVLGHSTFEQKGQKEEFPYVAPESAQTTFNVKYGEKFELFNPKKKLIAAITFARIKSRL